MTRALTQFLRRFRKNEDGQMLIEFTLLVPLIFTMFMTSIEMSIYSLQQVFLDRGLDMTVREIRLSTGTAPQHDELKDLICQYSGFLTDCSSTLRLEMVPVDPRNFSSLPGAADCIDTSEPVLPPRGFVNGQSHQVMLLRACVKFDPVFPTSGLGKSFSKDGSGKAQMISVAAFVQEPS